MYFFCIFIAQRLDFPHVPVRTKVLAGLGRKRRLSREGAEAVRGPEEAIALPAHRAGLIAQGGQTSMVKINAISVVNSTRYSQAARDEDFPDEKELPTTIFGESKSLKRRSRQHKLFRSDTPQPKATDEEPFFYVHADSRG